MSVEGRGLFIGVHWLPLSTKHRGSSSCLCPQWPYWELPERRPEKDYLWPQTTPSLGISVQGCSPVHLAQGLSLLSSLVSHWDVPPIFSEAHLSAGNRDSSPARKTYPRPVSWGSWGQGTFPCSCPSGTGLLTNAWCFWPQEALQPPAQVTCLLGVLPASPLTVTCGPVYPLLSMSSTSIWDCCPALFLTP